MPEGETWLRQLYRQEEEYLFRYEHLPTIDRHKRYRASNAARGHFDERDGVLVDEAGEQKPRRSKRLKTA